MAKFLPTRSVTKRVTATDEHGNETVEYIKAGVGWDGEKGNIILNLEIAGKQYKLYVSPRLSA